MSLVRGGPLPWWRSRRLGTVGTVPSASSPGGPSSRTCSCAWATPPGSVGRHLLGLPRSRSRPRSESGSGCTSASAFRIFHFAGFGATSERVAGTGTEVGDQAVIITQGGGSHLQNRLGTLGIVPEHLRPLDPVIQLLHQ